MNHRVGSLVWLSDKGEGLGAGRVRRPVIGLAALMLVVLGVAAALVIGQANVSSEVQGVVDASSMRWSALGAAYVPDYEAVAAVSSARWTALGESYASFTARAADAARWVALGESYAPDYEAIAAVSSARWNALGEWHLGNGGQGE
jgi:hypothetical protein